MAAAWLQLQLKPLQRCLPLQNLELVHNVIRMIELRRFVKLGGFTFVICKTQPPNGISDLDAANNEKESVTFKKMITM